MKVLYVENHAVFAENVKKQFLSTHAVTVVPSLHDAREEMLAGAFDVFLVDYDLDDGKGDELVAALHGSGNDAIIIAVSSHDDGNAALLKAGAVAVCSKMQFDRIETVMQNAIRAKARK